MREKVTNKLEKRAAETVMVAMLIVVLLSSCGTTSRCGHTWSAATNCPAYR